MPEFDHVIRGGIVVDGTRVPAYRADVGIKDGVVRRIGSLRASEGVRELDAGGMIVAPGFVDLHTHYDAQLYWDPYCTLSGWHGVTSVVIGNCGFGFAPVRPEDRDRAMLSMTRVEAIPYESMKAGLPWDWVTFPEFLDSVERAPKALNVLSYVPVGPLLVWVLGLDGAKSGREPTDDERARLCGLLDEAMDAGACGWSAQRLPPEGGAAGQRDYDGTPMPSDRMSNRTALALAEVLRRRNEGYIQMSISSGSFERDLRHIEELAAVSGRPYLYNVVAAIDTHPNYHKRLLKWLADCRRRGLRVYGQGETTDAPFTFTFDIYNLFDDSDAWCEAMLGSPEERMRKLADPARRQAMREHPPRFTGGLSEILVVEGQSPETKAFEGLTVGAVAKAQGKDAIDAMFDLALADGLQTVFSDCLHRSLQGLRDVVEDEYVLFGVSDGGAHTKFLTAGRYPTETLIKVVREHEMISLEQVHWRLSALPAWFAGFGDGRGTLREGSPADVVVYDFDHLELGPMEIAYDFPGGEWRRIQKATGYRYVLVNGTVTIEEDRELGAAPGHLLRHGVAPRPEGREVGARR